MSEKNLEEELFVNSGVLTTDGKEINLEETKEVLIGSVNVPTKDEKQSKEEPPLSSELEDGSIV